MSETAVVHEAEARLQTILKAVVVGAKTQDPASRPGGEDLSAAFASVGAIEPPYDPEALCLLTEHSNSLRQNVDAYATNIDGFGHRFEPAIDFDADDADDRIADSIYLERLAARDRGELPADSQLQPTTEEVTERKRELVQLARIERARLESFFDFCCFDHSFVDLRRRTRQDLEVSGNAFWEVLRDGRGEIARLVYVPSYSVRLMPLDLDPVEVEDRVRVSSVAFDTVSTRRRLRRYVQIQGFERVYFKSFGDPRIVSRKTGGVFADAESLVDTDPGDGPATELVHFSVHSPRSPYGVPRWVGTMLAVLGSRQMEEVNYLYFENKSVPPLALLVSGGRLSEASVPRIERFGRPGVPQVLGADDRHRVHHRGGGGDPDPQPPGLAHRAAGAEPGPWACAARAVGRAAMPSPASDPGGRLPVPGTAESRWTRLRRRDETHRRHSDPGRHQGRPARARFTKELEEDLVDHDLHVGRAPAEERSHRPLDGEEVLSIALLHDYSRPSGAPGRSRSKRRGHDALKVRCAGRALCPRNARHVRVAVHGRRAGAPAGRAGSRCAWPRTPWSRSSGPDLRTDPV